MVSARSAESAAALLRRSSACSSGTLGPMRLTAYDRSRKPHLLRTGVDTRTIKIEWLTQELSCGLCKKTIQNAMVIRNCMHRFCADCILPKVQTGVKKCPLCKKVLPKKTPLKSDANFDSVINKFAMSPERKTLKRSISESNSLCFAKRRLFSLDNCSGKKLSCTTPSSATPKQIQSQTAAESFPKAPPSLASSLKLSRVGLDEMKPSLKFEGNGGGCSSRGSHCRGSRTEISADESAEPPRLVIDESARGGTDNRQQSTSSNTNNDRTYQHPHHQTNATTSLNDTTSNKTLLVQRDAVMNFSSSSQNTSCLLQSSSGTSTSLLLVGATSLNLGENRVATAGRGEGTSSKQTPIILLKQQQQQNSSRNCSNDGETTSTNSNGLPKTNIVSSPSSFSTTNSCLASSLSQNTSSNLTSNGIHPSTQSRLGFVKLTTDQIDSLSHQATQRSSSTSHPAVTDSNNNNKNNIDDNNDNINNANNPPSTTINYISIQSNPQTSLSSQLSRDVSTSSALLPTMMGDNCLSFSTADKPLLIRGSQSKSTQQISMATTSSKILSSQQNSNITDSINSVCASIFTSTQTPSEHARSASSSSKRNLSFERSSQQQSSGNRCSTSSTTIINENDAMAATMMIMPMEQCPTTTTTNSGNNHLLLNQQLSSTAAAASLSITNTNMTTYGLSSPCEYLFLPSKQRILSGLDAELILYPDASVTTDKKLPDCAKHVRFVLTYPSATIAHLREFVWQRIAVESGSAQLIQKLRKRKYVVISAVKMDLSIDDVLVVNETGEGQFTTISIRSERCDAQCSSIFTITQPFSALDDTLTVENLRSDYWANKKRPLRLIFKFLPLLSSSSNAVNNLPCNK